MWLYLDLKEYVDINCSATVTNDIHIFTKLQCVHYIVCLCVHIGVAHKPLNELFAHILLPILYY